MFFRTLETLVLPGFREKHVHYELSLKNLKHRFAVFYRARVVIPHEQKLLEDNK